MGAGLMPMQAAARSMASQAWPRLARPKKRTLARRQAGDRTVSGTVGQQSNPWLNSTPLDCHLRWRCTRLPLGLGQFSAPTTFEWTYPNPLALLPFVAVKESMWSGEKSDAPMICAAACRRRVSLRSDIFQKGGFALARMAVWPYTDAATQGKMPARTRVPLGCQFLGA